MIKKEFDEFIANQVSETKEIEIDWQKECDEWLNYLTKFYKKIETFLQEYIEKGQIKIDHDKKTIYEEYIGEYEVETRIIQFGRNQIKFDPIGTNIIGAKGRVDMIGPYGKVKFLLVHQDALRPRVSVQVIIKGQKLLPNLDKPKKIEWAWKIVTPPPNINYIDLEQESFFDAFMEVVNG